MANHGLQTDLFRVTIFLSLRWREIVVRQAALNAWKAVNGGTLSELLLPYDSRTRGAEGNLRKPVSRRCLATSNMANCWNAHEPLRNAKTIGEARSAARKLANAVRHK